jgi:hypothetical protein
MNEKESISPTGRGGVCPVGKRQSGLMPRTSFLMEFIVSPTPCPTGLIIPIEIIKMPVLLNLISLSGTDGHSPLKTQLKKKP